MNKLLLTVVLIVGQLNLIPAEDLETRLEQVGIDSIHDTIGDKVDKLLKKKYDTLNKLDSCIEGLNTAADIESFRSSLLDCIDAALKAPPTSGRQINRIVSKPGKLSRLRFRWLYMIRLSLPCIRIKMLRTQYKRYLPTGYLPQKSADLVRFHRMCIRIKKASMSVRATYRRFIATTQPSE